MFFSYRGALLVSVAVAAGALAPCAWGQSAETGGTGPTITVLATGSRLPVNQAGQSISVIDSSEIAKVQGPDLTRVLERLPGVALAREGGVGSQTSLFVRGADSEQLLVLVDGVRVADVTSPGGGYDLGNMLAGNIARVELLRGSNSVVWGSDAIGGALAITTAEVNGAQASAEYGAYNSRYVTAGAGVKRDAYAFSLSGGYDYSAGFPAVPTATREDGFTQWQVSGKGRVALGESLALKVTGRYSDGRLDIESFGAAAEQWTRQSSGGVRLDYTGEALKLSAGVSMADTSRYYSSIFGPYDYLGLAERADLTGHLALLARFALDFGADREWQRSDSTFDARQSDNLTSGHALLGWYGGVLSLAGGVRVDDHSQFGTHVTTGANGSLALGGGWRARASYGEGFKAPTLYQLYDPFYGSSRLMPETSRSFDLGLERGARGGAQYFSVTFFRRDTSNLIDFIDCVGTVLAGCNAQPFGYYDNVSNARAQGVEWEMSQRVTGNFRVSANYTYVESRNLATRRNLARRPRNTVNLMADWDTPLRFPAGRFSLGGDLTMVSNAVDYLYGGAPVRVGGHVVATLRALVPITDQIEMFGRVENVGDARYQTVHGYNTARRSAYLGVRARL